MKKCALNNGMTLTHTKIKHCARWNPSTTRTLLVSEAFSFPLLLLLLFTFRCATHSTANTTDFNIQQGGWAQAFTYLMNEKSWSASVAPKEK
jgi:hypothetical protein